MSDQAGDASTSTGSSLKVVAAPQLQRFLLHVLPTGRYTNGQSEDSTVEELTTPEGLNCVGKKVRVREGTTLREKLVDECMQIFTLRHPNVILYLGLSVRPQAGGLLEAVMEYLPHSLAQVLQITGDIPHPVKRSVLVDVARGISYLHTRSPPIIHGKLTSTNVLLTSALTAKVSDVGEMLHTNPPYLPGGEVMSHLPPEAIQDPSLAYTSTPSDIFSFGKLIVLTNFRESGTFVSTQASNNTSHGQPESTQVPLELNGREETSATQLMEMLVDWCLQTRPGDRPLAKQVLDVLMDGWSELKCSYKQLVEMKLGVAVKLMEHSLFNVFQQGDCQQGDCHQESTSSVMEDGEEDTAGNDDSGWIQESLDEVPTGTMEPYPQSVEDIISPEVDTYSDVIHTVQIDVVDDTAQKKIYQCKFCNASFARSNGLKRHVQNHTGQKPYKCSTCSASFSNPSGLKRHTLTHSGQKNFKCTLCEASFTQAAHRNEHMRKHTGERPFPCQLCEAKFTSSSDLKRHMLTHTGEKPHECKVCSTKFKQSVHLKEHLRTHTGEKPYHCDMCNAKFARGNHLKRHKLTHTGEKPLRCQFCDAKFGRMNSLKRHVSSHHAQQAQDPEPVNRPDARSRVTTEAADQDVAIHRNCQEGADDPPPPHPGAISQQGLIADHTEHSIIAQLQHSYQNPADLPDPPSNPEDLLSQYYSLQSL